MTMVITDDCINCGACEVECPTEAIYGPGKIGKRTEDFSLLFPMNTILL